MKELSLHILDLGQNSITANANLIDIIIEENLESDFLHIEVIDDGVGMDQSFLKEVENPFVTTRETRKVGLGISLMKSAAMRCGGDFKIQSEKGKGTKITCSFKHSHIDRAPLGKLGETIVSFINSRDSIDVVYRHILDGEKFTFDSREIREVLGELPLTNTEVLLWIKDHINDNIRSLYIHRESL